MAAITTAGSNFDVQGLVSQLMSLEQAPLTSSKNRISTYNNQISSLGKLKSTLSEFQTSLPRPDLRFCPECQQNRQ